MSAWSALKRSVGDYLAHPDALAEAANRGAFLVWSSQPLYPLYVYLIVGRDAWPALLTWLSTPIFASVPIVARRSAVAGRALFVGTGVLNTLLSAVAMGPAAGIVWFLIPCLILAIGFFRWRERHVAAASTILVGLGALASRVTGPGFVAYAPDQSRSLSHLNAWSAAGLSIYLVYLAVRARRDVV